MTLREPPEGFLCGKSKPTRVFVTEVGDGAVRIGVIGMDIAAELLERGDFAVRRPANERNAVEFLYASVLHPVFEIPLDCGLIVLVEKSLDVPDKHAPARVPFVKPVLDLRGAVVFRPPAFRVHAVWRKNIADAAVLGPQPHLKPPPDDPLALFHLNFLLTHSVCCIHYSTMDRICGQAVNSGFAD